jgi:hypothetical protein
MGLNPQYYDGCTDDVLDLYGELEDRIVADIVRRIVLTGEVTESAKWQIRQAQQMGLLYDDILKEVAKSTEKSQKEVKKMFENAGVETVNNDNRIHLKGGASPLDIRQSESMLQILNSVYQNSLTDLKNLTGTTAITSQTAYTNACNSAFMMVSSGAFSYQQALKTVLSEVAQNGATVTYPSGHVDRLDVAVRRSLLTGIGLASRKISEENSHLCGCDLMEISAHSGARPSHASWQGQIVSLSGRKGYLSKSDIGYGTGAGFGGLNCRHDWYPFYEGISVPNYSQKDLDSLNAKDIEYNGKMYSEYEISQMLRAKERQARALKREKVALQTAVAEGQTYLKTDLKAVNTKISEKSKEIEQFCNETGYQRDRSREQVGGKTSVGHGSKKGLTSAQNSGKIKGRGSGNKSSSANQYCEYLGTIEFKDKKAVSKALLDFESQNKNATIERCIVITPNNEKYLVHGTLDTVDTTMLGDKLKGSINEHNHVTGESQYSFSYEDLESCVKDGTNTAFAFDEKYRYVMKFPNHKISEDDLYDAYQDSKDEVGEINFMHQYYGAEDCILDEDVQHEIIKRVCEGLGIIYERTDKT